MYLNIPEMQEQKKKKKRNKNRKAKQNKIENQSILIAACIT